MTVLALSGDDDAEVAIQACTRNWVTVVLAKSDYRQYDCVVVLTYPWKHDCLRENCDCLPAGLDVADTPRRIVAVTHLQLEM